MRVQNEILSSLKEEEILIERRIHRINKDIKIECVNRNIDMWKILSDDE
jgi:hypothetical protein